MPVSVAGSAVGALYASGMPVIDIERRFINLDRLVIPFRAVATDLETGKPVVIELGATSARTHAVELNRLRVSKKQWATYKGEMASRIYLPGPIVQISINQGSKLASDFPQRGGFAGIRGQLHREDLGSDRHFDSVTGMLLKAHTWKGFTLAGLLYAEAVTRGEPGIENAVRLGGFRRLSAFAPAQSSLRVSASMPSSTC